ncbi:MAG: hypothetical protein KJ062_03470, partial [Thermoanaerobaculia bacterium]|nr:hypothetical protein [Thermoanaerobaculia bacterium]
MKWIERAGVTLLFLLSASSSVHGQQGRSEAQLQIDVEHASLKEQLARDVLERRQALAKQGLVSEAELR